MRLISAVLFLFSLSSCGGEKSGSLGSDDFDVAWVEVEKPYAQQNIQVPRKVWDLIKSSLEGDGVSKETLSAYEIYPTKINVEIRPKDVGVTEDNGLYKVLFPEGGGELDLFDQVKGKGSFTVRLAPSLMNDVPFHLLYISDSPGKVVGGDKWGHGCGQIFDLSEQAYVFTVGAGILASTGKRQYMHLLSGTYIFFQMVEDRLLMSYIRLFDSRYPQFTCVE